MVRLPRPPRPVQAADANGHGNGRGAAPPRRTLRRRDWGRAVARLLCVLFALVGFVPLLLGLLVRTETVQRWASAHTATLLREQLGVEASYELALRPWPLEITLEQVRIDSDDGGAPLFEADRVVARPRVFSLLAYKLDLGSVEIEEPRIRAVVREGGAGTLLAPSEHGGWRLANLTLPERETSDEGETPLTSVSLTNGKLLLQLADVELRAVELDVDVGVEGDAFEVLLRSGRTELDRTHASPAPTPKATAEDATLVDEDAICRLDLRARVSPDELLVRRLRLSASVDFDPAPGSRPSCDLGDDDWRRFELSLEAARVELDEGAPSGAGGRVSVRAPVGLVHRFVAVSPVSGWVAADLEAAWQRGDELPSFAGNFSAGSLSLEAKIMARAIAGQIESDGEKLRLEDLAIRWGGGEVAIASATVAPFAEGVPLDARGIEIRDVKLEEMLNDLGAHPHAHVAWHLLRTTVDRFHGTIVPLDLSGPLRSDTRGFTVFDGPHDAPAPKATMMRVEQGTVNGTFRVHDEGILLEQFHIVTPRSNLATTVSLAFDERLGISVFDGSYVDLRDVSPLVDIPMEGLAHLSIEGHGMFEHPILDGSMRVAAFRFAGLPVGEVVSKVHFQPLALALRDATLTHGSSSVAVPTLTLDFDAIGPNAGSDVVLQGRLDARASGLHTEDFYEIIELGDDPRFADMQALLKGTADVDFVLGGPGDPCGAGNLRVRARMGLADVRLWGERYDAGDMDVDFRWMDPDAGDHGMNVDVLSAALRKGSGTVLARATVRRGARLRADVTGSGIPIDRLSAFRRIFGPPGQSATAVQPEATVAFVATVGGTLGRIEGDADVEVSELRIGPDVLPTSRLHLAIVPTRDPEQATGFTRCGDPISGAFDRQRWDGDPVDGVFRLSGKLFGGQVELEDMEVTQQRQKLASGTLTLRKLDLGALANLLPDVAFSASPPRGELTAVVHIDELPFEEPALAEVRVELEQLALRRGGHTVEVGRVEEPLVLSGDSLRVPELPLVAHLRTGARGSPALVAQLIAGGTVEQLSTRPALGLSLRLLPIDLAKLLAELPSIDRAGGTVQGEVRLTGTTEAPRLGGRVDIDDGSLRVRGLPIALDAIDVAVRIENGEVRIDDATARAGNTGMLHMTARVPLDGFDVGAATATVVARDVKLPLADGVKLTANAMLSASYDPADATAERTAKPHVSGTVSLSSFHYTRPMSFKLDLEQLTGGRSEIESYDPADDFVSFDVNVVSPRALRVSNNLIDMKLDVTPPGVRIVGTNQRYGAVGGLRIESGSKILLQGHDFAVGDGVVSFDDTTRVAPRLDVHATTEYRRYATSADLDAAAASADAASAATAASTGGKWRIHMHAYGDIATPKVTFTSDPPLSQDDVVLLLQVGMTRAELDRGLAGSLAQTVGLEALSAVTGFDQAVRSSVPIIDEFRIGSQYSSRSGRPEPSVSVGKRLSDSVRATVTTGLSENREVRSNLEWKLDKGLSVQGSYDNVNDVSSSTFGNIGADLRWRLEFE